MYTILVKNDNTMQATVKSVIMQRSKLVDQVQILVPRTYNGIDMTSSTCLMEYILPVSKKYESVILTLKNANYVDGYELQYVLEGDTNITTEAGDIRFQLTFNTIALETVDGEIVPKTYVRKIGEYKIPITGLSMWSDYIPDAALSAIDQRIIKLNTMANQLDETLNKVESEMVSGMVVDSSDKTLELKDKLDNTVGEPVKIMDMIDAVHDDVFGKDLDGIIDGIVDLDNQSGSDGDNSGDSGNEDGDVDKPDCDCGCNDNSGVVDLDKLINR